MRKLLFLLVFLPFLAFAGAPDTFTRRDWVESQNVTRSAPTLATEGVRTDSAVSITFIVDAGSGKTLTGVGTLDVYLYDRWDTVNLSWAKWPSRSMTLSGCSGVRFCIIDSFSVDGPRYAQRLLPAAVGVGVSSGTTVSVSAFVSVSANSRSQ